MVHIKIEITEDFHEIKFKGTKKDLLQKATYVLIKEKNLLGTLKELIRVTEHFMKTPRIQGVGKL